MLVRKTGILISFSKCLASFGHLQRLSPDGTETLLDHHLATFDGWLQKYLTSSSPRSHFLAFATLWDQLDPEEYDRTELEAILSHPLLFGASNMLSNLVIGRKKEFTRILSKFLMDRDRAGFFWVNPQTYVELVPIFLEILRDK